MKIALLALSISLIALPALAQDAKPLPPVVAPVSTATPEELAEGKKRLDALISAHGGEKFLKLTSFTLKGKGEATMPGGDQKIPFESLKLSFALPDKMRLDISSFFGDIVQVTPGGGKKPFMVMAGQVQDPPFDLSLPDPTAILREAAQRSLAVTPVADIKDGEKVLQGVSLPDEPKKPATTLYFDEEKHLIRRIVLKTTQGAITVNLNGYKTTDGIALPGGFALVQGKETLLSMTFDTAKVNPTFPDNYFSPPK